MMIRIKGKIVQSRTRSPVAGYRVEAWANERAFTGALGEADTSGDGSFTIDVRSIAVIGLIFQLRPNVFFKLCKDGAVVLVTACIWTLEWVDKEIECEVDTGQAKNPLYVVRGRVQGADGKPLGNATVRAFDKDLRSEQELGDDKTDANGNYVIGYRAASFKRAEKLRADLVVRAYGNANALLTSSSVVFNAPEDATVNLMVGVGDAPEVSEFEQLVRDVEPVLDGVAFQNLTPEDIAFLTRETEIAAERIEVLKTCFQSQVAADLPAAAFYAFERAGLTAALARVLAFTNDDWTEALSSAVRENVVPRALEAQIPTIVAALAARRIKQGLDAPAPDPALAPLGGVLQLALDAAADRELVTSIYLANSDDVATFWQKLSAQPSFDPPKVQKLQNVLRMTIVAQNHLPTARKLQARLGDSSPEALTTLTTTQWLDLVKAPVAGGESTVPTDIVADNEAGRQLEFARILEGTIERAWPTLAARARLREAGPVAADLVRVLDNATGFDLVQSSVERYLAANPGALNGVSDRPAAIRDLKALQRMVRVTGSVTQARTLISVGATSAVALSSIPEAQFLTTYSSALGGAGGALRVYRNAQQVAAAAFLLVGNYSHLFVGNVLTSLPYWPTDAEGLPEWRTLFGPIDSCECEHCLSIFSPAAYYVDLLQLLQNRTATTEFESPTALQRLLERRPDLVEIRLDCDNTNTPLPHIDLVNEVLERHIVRQGELPQPPFFQTTLSAEELRATPEHQISVLYEPNGPLVSQTYPWALPFNLSFERAFVYLTHLKIDRSDLIALCLNASTEDSVASAQWQLGMCPEEWAWLIALDGGTGIPVDDLARQAWGTNDLSGLANMATLTAATRLPYEELRSVLEQGFVSGGETIVITTGEGIPEDTCAPELLYVLQIEAEGGPGLLTRLAAFLRVQRHLRVSARELNHAISVLSDGARLDAVTLARLAGVVKLQRELRWSLDQTLTLFGPMSTGEDSLFERTFLDRAVVEPTPAAFSLTDATAVALDAIVSPIAAALGLSIADTMLAVEATRRPEPVSAATMLGHLTRVFGYALLARALRGSISDVRAFETLLGVSALTDRRPVVVAAFIARVRALQAGPLSRVQLQYLLADERAAAEQVGPASLAIDAALRVLHEELLRIASETDPDRDFTREDLRRILGMLTRNDGIALDADRLLAFVETLPANDGPNQAGLDALWLVDDADRYAELLRGPVSDPDGAEARTQRAAARRHLWTVAAQRVRAKANVECARQWLANALGLDTSTTRLLAEQLIRSAANPALTALAALIAEPDSPEAARASYLRLLKVATLIRALKLSEIELAFVARRADLFANLDFNTLPIAGPVDPQAWLRSYEALLGYAALRDRLPKQETPLIDVLRAAEPGSTRTPVAALSAAAGWEEAEISEALAALNLASDQLSVPAVLQRMEQVMRTVRLSSVAALTLRGWSETIDIEAADAMRAAVKSRYDNATWLTVAAPLQDAIRIKQRDALVAFTLAHTQPAVAMPWQKEDDLFGYFLLDTQISPCQLTSRIVQATGSVQLFIQRALMGMETPSYFTPADAKRWRQFMSRYRLWEANLRIFAYPENWLRSELRDDKTPFFKELEDELLQGEITEARAESAIHHYLEKLHDVSRLQVVGQYQETEQEPGEASRTTLHVVARTRGTPHRYFHRKRVDKKAWTPWLRLDADIEGEHVLPIVYNRRLHVFWSVITEKAREAKVPAADSAGSAPPSSLEIKLAYSVFDGEKWSPKRVSTSAYTMPLFASNATIPPRDPSKCVLKGRINERGELAIDLFAATTNFLFDVSVIFGSSPGSASASPQKPRRFATFIPRCDGSISVADTQANITLDAPPNAAWKYNQLVEPNKPDEALNLYSFGQYRLALRATPGEFTLSPAHQETQFRGQIPLFYDGNDASYVVTSRDTGLFWRPFELPPLLSRPGFFGSLVPNRIPPSFAPTLVNYVSSGTKTWLSTAKVNASLLGEVASASAAPAAKASVAALALPSANLLATDFSVARTIQRLRLDLNLDVVGTIRGLTGREYRFELFFHPFTCTFLEILDREGISGLLDRDVQAAPWTHTGQRSMPSFSANHQPTTLIDRRYPALAVDFEPDGAYAAYNWELFFHIPLLLAEQLSENLRFEEAQRWFHFIFNPMSSRQDVFSSSGRFWESLPIYRQGQGSSADELARLLSSDAQQQAEARQRVREQIEAWLDNPFQPHLIARMRHGTYARAVVMKYIDNLVRWGDYLFRQERLESLNQATNLYVLASELLGPRPQRVSPRGETEGRTFTQLTPRGPLTTILEGVEALYQPGEAMPQPQELPAGLGQMRYFCVPKNDQLLSYWDTLADRLFKLRNCLDIEGRVRQLPLFEPPIDPALLVRAAALGIDPNSALSAPEASVPYYRFDRTLALAKQVVSDVRALGSALLNAMERRDAETLEQLRAEQQVRVLDSMDAARKKQIDQAKEALTAARETKAHAEIRRDFYGSREFMNPAEKTHLALTGAGAVLQAVGQVLEAASGAAALTPQFNVGVSGWAGSPVATMDYGGQQISRSLAGWGRALNVLGQLAYTGGSMAGTVGGYQRREDDWKLQEELADSDVRRTEREILMAEIRLAIVEQEYDTHKLQEEQAAQIREHFQSKYTSKELYSWMVGQLSALYFQSYQLAYDLAKRAERAFQFERVSTESHVEFGHWDSLRKGLLCGERLNLQLHRLEAAYLEEGRRDYEITKHLSLAMHDPVQLLALRQNGACEIDIPESAFDDDHLGHFMRRLHSVSLTIPAVTGPYTSINAKLTLLRHTMRVSPLVATGYPRDTSADDPRFVDGSGALQAIVTSSGRNDGGLFQLTASDDRYSPFEGAGAISRFRLEIPRDTNRFDPQSITDVILHLNYSAREGGEGVRAAALAARIEPSAGFALISSRHAQADAWQRMITTPASQLRVLELDWGRDQLPYEHANTQIEVATVFGYIVSETPSTSLSIPGELAAPGTGGVRVPLSISTAITSLGAPIRGPLGRWTYTIPAGEVVAGAVKDVLWVVGYRVG